MAYDFWNHYRVMVFKDGTKLRAHGVVAPTLVAAEHAVAELENLRDHQYVAILDQEKILVWSEE